MFSKSEYTNRIRAVQSKLKPSEALLVSKDANARYFTGVESGRLLIWKGGAKYWLNEVYFGLAKGSPIEPIPSKKDAIKKFIFSKRFKTVYVDEMALAGYRAAEPRLRKLFLPSDMCEQARMIKSPKEIRLLEDAGKIASKAMSAIAESRLPGMSEFELAGILECEIRILGSEKPPFSGGLLCMSGENSAYPHAPVSGRRIRDGDLLIIDLGAVVGGYHSDMTRTFKVGKVDKKKADLVSFADNLKEDAIRMVQPGGKVSDVHNFINKAIEKKGYKFAHLSGHGVGLEIHEKPSIGPDEKEVFKSGMVFTIEPGIYTTKYGARSEDTIALIGRKKRILTW